ncbi:Bifunctional inhibitor/lipid-transfer protein/seed storage 2S albumin superfamily protein [Abeliophyllum distichum]|uniref:Bifunctional inhibitor/lipid-transfer protein/seed storage 2S albumin superfamily protein n=1 Tax=Abeliophyllum distichum TaxID=126358 RepID=A0ABD1Q6T0_9LAMI
MDAKYVCILFFILFGIARSDLGKDREQCANQLVGLATCLPYVGGDAKVPTLDCCTGLKQVLHTSPECICILVKDRNDPSLGLKINATLALGLPIQCHAPANISNCPALLHLAPNSPDAKVFEDFANSAKNSTATAQVKGDSTSKGTSSDEKSNGGKRLSLGLLFTIVLYILPTL